MAAFLPLFPWVPARAQTSTTEFLPEIDAHLKLRSNIRFVFQAKDTREGGDPTQVELGPSIDFYLKRLVKLRDISAFDLDDSKSRLLVLSIGYRYIPSPNKPPAAAGAVHRISVYTFAEQATRKPHRASYHLSLPVKGRDANFRQKPRRS